MVLCMLVKSYDVDIICTKLCMHYHWPVLSTKPWFILDQVLISQLLACSSFRVHLMHINKSFAFLTAAKIQLFIILASAEDVIVCFIFLLVFAHMFCVLYVMFWLCVVCTIECSQLLVPSLPFKCQSVPPQPNLDLTSSSSLLSSTLQKSGCNVYVVFKTDQSIKDWRRRFCVKSKRGWISVEAISWGLLTAHNLTSLDRATSNFFEILRHTHTISILLQREVFKTAKVRGDVWRCWFGQ